MAERKVLNKYFPADFDPSKIPRRKMPKDKQQVIRLMAPFSMRCSTCGEYMYKGKKFNARKETVIGEEYYGIKIFRFYIKCITCSSEITFKTDPKNTDYAVEHGAYRNFEPWRDASDTQDNEDKLDQLEAQEAEENDPMASLESKAVDSKREMDILDALQELRSRNARHERAGEGDVTDKILDRVSSGVEVGDREVERKLTEFELRRKKEEEEDEEEVRKVFGRAFVAGVPDIELEEGGTTTEEDSEPGTPRNDGEQPEASGSGSSAPPKPAPSAASVKRKLDAVEPTPASLLSAASRSIVDKSFGGGAVPPPKKKKVKGNAALAAKLGIKLKK